MRHLPGVGRSLAAEAGRARGEPVTMQIFPGETLGLVGESGSGKSTLGRALLQLERVADGEVRFEGQRITHGLTSDIARLRQQSAMIFQIPLPR